MFPSGSWLLSTGQHTAVCNPHGTDFCKSHEVGVQFHFVSQIDSQHHLLKRLQLLIFLLIWNVAFASFKCICVHLHIHHSNVYVCVYVYRKCFPKSSYFHNNLLKIMYTNEWICLWGLRFVPLLYLSTSIPLSNCLQVHSNLWYPVEQASPTLVLKSVLANLSPLHFFVPFSISLSVSTKTKKIYKQISLRFLLGLHRIYRSTWRELIVTILSCPSHEHGLFLYLFGSSWIFLNIVL